MEFPEHLLNLSRTGVPSPQRKPNPTPQQTTMQFNKVLIASGLLATAATAAPASEASSGVQCKESYKGKLILNVVRPDMKHGVSIDEHADKKYGERMLHVQKSVHPSHRVVFSECTGGPVPKSGERKFGTVELEEERGQCLFFKKEKDQWKDPIAAIGVKKCPGKDYKEKDMFFASYQDADKKHSLSVATTPSDPERFNSYGVHDSVLMMYPTRKHQHDYFTSVRIE